MGISRRSFLIGTGGVLAVGAAAERTTSWATRRPVLRWADDLSGTTSARDLGVEYLTRTPAEADRALLLSRLASLVGFSALLASPERAPIGFHDQMRRDFVEGDLVRMGGWLLSRTELRLCALAVLEEDEETGMSGVFAPHHLPSGEALYWTTPAARFIVPPDMPSLEVRLRSGAREPQRVAVRIAGETVDELQVWGREWQRARYVMRPSGGRATTLDLTTTPEWKPFNDFRTMGVGIDRVWGAEV